MKAPQKQEWLAFMYFQRIPRILAAKLRLSLTELFILYRIEQLSCRGEELNVSSLHDAEKMSLPAVSQTLSKLEKRKLIERAVSKKDRRRVSLSITEEGRQSLAGDKERIRSFFKKAVGRFGEDDFERMCRLMLRFTQVLEDIEGEPPSREEEPES